MIIKWNNFRSVSQSFFCKSQVSKSLHSSLNQDHTTEEFVWNFFTLNLTPYFNLLLLDVDAHFELIWNTHGQPLGVLGHFSSPLKIYRKYWAYFKQLNKNTHWKPPPYIYETICWAFSDFLYDENNVNVICLSTCIFCYPPLFLFGLQLLM